MGTLSLSLVIFLLYASVASLGTYVVTVGGLVVPIFVVATLHLNYGNYRHILPLTVMLGYPVVIYVCHILLGTAYALPFVRFILSYGLWCVSVLVIWCAFQPKWVVADFDPVPLLCVLLALAAFQYVAKAFLGSSIGFDIIQPISRTNFHNGYVSIDAARGTRAVGPYYEPSMLGRVLTTLVMIYFARTRKLVPAALMLTAGYFLSGSFSLVVLAAAAFITHMIAARRRVLRLLILFALCAVAVSPILERRLVVANGGIARNSTYVRVVLPLLAIADTVPKYPFGVPVGSNELVVKNTIGNIPFFDEPKITNGFYEQMLYFGICFLLLLLYMMRTYFVALAKGDEIPCQIIVYLTLATAASGSLFSIESSLLIAIFIICMRKTSPFVARKYLPVQLMPALDFPAI